VVDNVTGELKVAPTVLIERGEKGVELCLSKADNMGSGFFSELFKIKLSSGAKCLLSGLGSRW